MLWLSLPGEHLLWWKVVESDTRLKNTKCKLDSTQCS